MKFTVDLNNDSVEMIKQVLECVNRKPGNYGGLTIETLGEMLLEDVSVLIRRPRSAAAENMTEVLAGHGYIYDKHD